MESNDLIYFCFAGLCVQFAASALCLWYCDRVIYDFTAKT